ncbi:unnamed protein product, partial [Symbiodinium sp. CCMP2456]
MSAVQPDDEAYFTALLQSWKIPESLRGVLQQKGYTTLSLIAHALPSLDQLEMFVVATLGRPTDHSPDQPLFTPEAAALRRIVHEASRMLVLPAPSAGASAGQPVALPSKSRITAADKITLLQEFQRKYPSEYLRPETSPSLSFLNQAKDAVDAKSMGWIAWRYRTSEADEASWTEHRPLEPIVRRYIEILCHALAMLSAMHLFPLRKMQERFVAHAIAQPADKTLQAPNLTEIMQADKVFWLGVLTLQTEHAWSLDDSVAEMIHMRPDVLVALAPRPKAVSLPGPSPDARKRSAGSKAEKSSGAPAKKAKNQSQASAKAGASPDKITVKNWPANWSRQIQGKAVCIRFH